LTEQQDRYAATDPDLDQRARRQVFGEAVEQYESARPGYPPDLVTDVLAYADPGPVLEVGAGTGKATVAFAAYGRDITCVEPDPRMAAALERNCQPYPAVSVVLSGFETWRPDRRFGLLYSAQAWHWVDRERRMDLAYAALAPGGAFALFWNNMLVRDPALRTALAAADARHGIAEGRTMHGRDTDAHGSEIGDDFHAEWSELGLAGDDRFTELRSRRYRRSHEYPTAGYLDLLASTSAYRVLEPAQRDAVLADIASVLDAHGGTVELSTVTDLALGRRTRQDRSD